VPYTLLQRVASPGAVAGIPCSFGSSSTRLVQVAAGRMCLLILYVVHRLSDVLDGLVRSQGRGPKPGLGQVDAAADIPLPVESTVAAWLGRVGFWVPLEWPSWVPLPPPQPGHQPTLEGRLIEDRAGKKAAGVIYYSSWGP